MTTPAIPMGRGNRGAGLACLLAVFMTAFASSAGAQTRRPGESPLPVVTGVMGYESTFITGMQTVNPQFDPILLVPLGKRALIESEFEMRVDLAHALRWTAAVQRRSQTDQ